MQVIFHLQGAFDDINTHFDCLLWGRTIISRPEVLPKRLNNISTRIEQISIEGMGFSDRLFHQSGASQGKLRIESLLFLNKTAIGIVYPGTVVAVFGARASGDSIGDVSI